MDQRADKQTKEKAPVMTAEDCKEFINRLQRKYKFLRHRNKDFDAWDHYDASEVLGDLVAFLRDYDVKD